MYHLDNYTKSYIHIFFHKNKFIYQTQNSYKYRKIMYHFEKYTNHTFTYIFMKIRHKNHIPHIYTSPIHTFIHCMKKLNTKNIQIIALRKRFTSMKALNLSSFKIRPKYFDPTALTQQLRPKNLQMETFNT